MTSENLRHTTLVNLAWKYAQTFGTQILKLVVSIVLARLLTPSDFGFIALITVFTAILSVFVDGGFSSSLIQKKDADELDFSSIFWVNMAICLVLYAGMFLAAPAIAVFYDNEGLTPVIRVLCLTIVISGLSGVQTAYVSHNLKFKKTFVSGIVSAILSSIVGIGLALMGFGVWALVWQQIVLSSVEAVVLWIISGWRPRFAFSLARVKSLFSYGWKLFAANLLHAFYTNLRALIVGKWYSAADLGLFDQGHKFPEVVVRNVDTSISSVMFPVMSKSQDDPDRVRKITRQTIMVSSYIMWPLMMGLAGTSTVLVPLLLGDQWVDCVPYLMVFCFALGFQPMQTANLSAMKAMGRSDVFFALEIIKKIIAIALVLATAWISVFALCISDLVYRIISTVINAFPNRKLLGYSYFQQVRDVAPSFLLAFFMGAVVYFIPWPDVNLALVFLAQFATGVAIYLGGSALFKLEGFEYVKALIKDYIGKGNA